MKTLILQHENTVTAGSTIEWLDEKKMPYTIFRADSGLPFPDVDQSDLIFICGGSMNVDESDKYPWLLAEKDFIAKAIAKSKRMVGLCLGGQLLAESLKATVAKQAIDEAGWHPVELFETALAPGMQNLIVFQWHSYAFALPAGAKLLATNKFCKNQAFLFGPNIVGFQFHPETTFEWVHQRARTGSLPAVSESAQTETVIQAGLTYQPQLQHWYFNFLNRFIC